MLPVRRARICEGRRINKFATETYVYEEGCEGVAKMRFWNNEMKRNSARILGRRMRFENVKSVTALVIRTGTKESKL